METLGVHGLGRERVHGHISLVERIILQRLQVFLNRASGGGDKTRKIILVLNSSKPPFPDLRHEHTDENLNLAAWHHTARERATRLARKHAPLAEEEIAQAGVISALRLFIGGCGSFEEAFQLGLVAERVVRTNQIIQGQRQEHTLCAAFHSFLHSLLEPCA
jgi:hypothetical protein